MKERFLDDRVAAAKRPRPSASLFRNDLGKDKTSVTDRPSQGRIYFHSGIAVHDFIRLIGRLSVSQPVRIRARRSSITAHFNLPVEVAQVLGTVEIAWRGDVAVEGRLCPEVREVVSGSNVGLGEEVLRRRVRRLKEARIRGERHGDDIVIHEEEWKVLVLD